MATEALACLTAIAARGHNRACIEKAKSVSRSTLGQKLASPLEATCVKMINDAQAHFKGVWESARIRGSTAFVTPLAHNLLSVVMRENKSKVHPRPIQAARSSVGAEARITGRRIAKVIARAGLCSRREAEIWIGEGRVALNGVPLTTAAVNVTPEDKVTVDGKPLGERPRTRLFLFHKPRGLVTTARDPQGRPTIFDHLREHWRDGPRVVSIGRLDINSEGLLLLTNDGGLARVLELPSTGWVRRYRVRAKGETSQAILDGLHEGVTIESVHYAGIEATLDRVQGANTWLTMALREGKNREIKRVLEHLRLQVNRLIRLSYGPFQLGDLALGAVKEVPARVLRDQLGRGLAEAAGVDFSSPLHTQKEAAAFAGISHGREPQTSSTQIPRAARASGLGREIEPKAPAAGKPKPGPRKHISALRAEYGNPHLPRKRIEHGKTADRTGRMIDVERLVATAGAQEKQEKRQPKRTGKGRPIAAQGARLLADERKQKTPQQRREPRACGGAFGPRAGGGQRPRRPRKKS
jgi:23S rRNA pseudouridine2605 synthase